jgi:hypothetical protein
MPYDNDPERRRAYQTTDAYRALNAARMRKWRREHPATALDAVNRYQAKNPDVQLSLNRKRRARLRDAESDGHSRQQVFERDGGICQLCLAPLDPTAWHEDHIVPLSRGGSDLIENCQATCPPCNLSKGDRVA